MWALLFACFIFVQELVGPRSGDSVEYGFVYPAEGETNTYRPVSSLADLVESQANFYLGENGRVVVHSIVQPLCAINSPVLFALLDAAVYILLVCLLLRLLGWPARNRQVLIVAACAYFYISPSSTDIAFQVNYLWVATLVCGFLVAFFRCKSAKWWTWPLLVILGFATGESNEAFTVGLAVAILLHLIVFYRKTNAMQMVLAVAFFIGLAVNLFAPGNYVKLSEFVPHPWYVCIFVLIKNNWIIILPVVVTLLRCRKGFDARGYLRRYRFFITVLAAQAVVLLFLGTVYLYAGMGVRLMIIILLLGSLADWQLRRGWYIAGATAFCILGVFYVTKAALGGIKYRYILNEYLASPAGRVYLPSSLLEPDYRWTVLNSSTFTWIRRSSDAAAPAIRVLPAGIMAPEEMPDTTVVMHPDQSTWITVEPKRHQEELYLVKRLKTPNHPVISVRPVSYAKGAFLEYWDETDTHFIGVYYNRFPWLFDAEITSKKP